MVSSVEQSVLVALPAAFQAPRAWVLAGPVSWVLKASLRANLYREHQPLITWPDDPLDKTQWNQQGAIDHSDWPIVVAPGGFLVEARKGIVWGVLISRWATWHDAAHQMLEDAELSVRCDRYLKDEDPLPWEGANLRNGALVVDIVDKSGIHVGTATGGTILAGLRRAAAEFASDFIDSTVEIITDEVPPGEAWFRPGSRFTTPDRPYVVYQEGYNSPIQSSSFIHSPSKGVQVNVGGHSMPGVNEVVSASIQAAFDILGGLAQIGSLGGSVDQILRPLYEDVLLSWWSVKSPQRARNSGWSRLFEYYQEGSDRAYTLSALMVLRAGFWATKTKVSWKVAVADGKPFLIGDRGLGHFFMDDRVGLRLKGSQDIHMDRCRKIDLAWDAGNPPEWQITIGDDRVFQDPAMRAWGRIERMIAGMRDLGVY